MSHITGNGENRGGKGGRIHPDPWVVFTATRQREGGGGRLERAMNHGLTPNKGAVTMLNTPETQRTHVYFLVFFVYIVIKMACGSGTRFSTVRGRYGAGVAAELTLTLR